MPRLGRRRLVQAGAGALAASACPASAQPAWMTLPATPALPRPSSAGRVRIGDVELYHAVFGDGPPALFLHGGMGHSNYWGHQVAALAPRHRVIVLDSRGHGRSTLSARRMSYRLLADDVLGFLDAQNLVRPAIVGWSDGGIVGLDLAMRRPDRVGGLLAFGANFNLEGLRPEGAQGAVFTQYAERCRLDYATLSPKPANWQRLIDDLRRMWGSSPTWTPAQLARIQVPTTIVGAEHDEIIRRTHTEALAAAIPGARLAMLPAVSHFAMLQDPAQFTAELRTFLRS